MACVFFSSGSCGRGSMKCNSGCDLTCNYQCGLANGVDSFVEATDVVVGVVFI